MTMRERYIKALQSVAERKPSIYSPARVAANIRASEKMNYAELLYFVLAIESKDRRASSRTH